MSLNPVTLVLLLTSEVAAVAETDIPVNTCTQLQTMYTEVSDIYFLIYII